MSENRFQYHKFLPGVTDIVLLLVVWAWLVPTFSTIADDPGLGWHLRSGELMLEAGGALHFDPFLATESPLPWIADQWLGSVIVAGLFEAGGWKLLYIATLLLFLTVFFFLVLPVARRESSSPLVGLLAAVIALRLSSIHFIIRPVLFSFVLFALFVFQLYSMRPGLSICKKELTKMGALVLLCGVWANIHPSFVLGLLLLFVFAFGEGLDSFRRSRKPPPLRSLVVITSMCLLAAAATLLNPYGWELHQQTLRLATDSSLVGLMNEWKPLSLITPLGELFLVLIMIPILAFLLSAEFRARLRSFEGLWFILLSYFALASIRGVPIAAICLTPLFARALSTLLQHRWFDRFPEWRSSARWFSKVDIYEVQKSKGGFGFVVVLILCVMSNAIVPIGRGIWPSTLGPNPQKFQITKIILLRELAKERGEPIKVRNSTNLGGVIALFGYPWLKYECDDRLGLWKSFQSGPCREARDPQFAIERQNS